MAIYSFPWCLLCCALDPPPSSEGQEAQKTRIERRKKGFSALFAALDFLLLLRGSRIPSQIIDWPSPPHLLSYFSSEALKNRPKESVPFVQGPFFLFFLASDLQPPFSHQRPP